MKEIRIAHIAGGLTTGGVEAVIYNHFSRLDPEDYELVYISYGPPDPAVQRRFEDIGFTVYSVTKKRDDFIKSCREVLAIYRRHRINVVHSHMTLISFVTNFLASLCGIRVRIAHAHLALSASGLRRICNSACKILTRRTATDYFSCGAAAALYLFGKKQVARNRVFLMDIAIDPRRFLFNDEVRRRLRNELELGGSFCVGHVGRFTEQKNHAFLLDVFNSFHRLKPDSVLLLVGDGPLFADIKEKAGKLGLDGCVLLIGSTDRAEAYYQAMDCFVLPSLYEGLAIVRLEAQYAGLPVLISDTVARELDPTNAAEYMSLDSGPDAWAGALYRISNSDLLHRRSQCSKPGPDIVHQMTRLDAFYRQALGKTKR